MRDQGGSAGAALAGSLPLDTGPALRARTGLDDSIGGQGGPGAGGIGVRTRVFREGVLAEEDFPLADVHRFREDDDVIVWLDLRAPNAEQIRLVSDELQLDPHAVEDALSAGERAKLDRYPSYLFLNTYAVRLDVASGELVSKEISAFIAGRTLVTVRPDDSFDLDAVLRRTNSADLAAHGVGYLVHGIIDLVVDGYFTAVQALDGALEDLEDMLFDDDVPEATVHRRSFELRKSLVQLRREVLPMREAVNSLMRRDTGLVTDGLVSSYRDVYDHVLRATEWTESLRDMINSILDTNLTIQSNRLNLVMKKMTGWAAIIAVPTLITGFFGQNVPYPGSGESWGFAVDLLILVVSAAILYVVFRRKGWL
ncbi:magnesium transporter CorA family protein [Frankia gtarii]|uniref:magnesium transporter CorA family protein n=1 Tax=Frankia gtarii TaxID=2950102 RepID=UPI0021C073CF|nr:magnesium transporter CorA family protein [Frankia gtarii]